MFCAVFPNHTSEDRRFCSKRTCLVRVVEVGTCYLFIAYFSYSLPSLSTLAPESLQGSGVSQVPQRHITVLFFPIPLLLLPPFPSSSFTFSSFFFSFSPLFFIIAFLLIVSNNHYLRSKHWMRHFVCYLKNFTKNSIRCDYPHLINGRDKAQEIRYLSSRQQYFIVISMKVWQSGKPRSKP